MEKKELLRRIEKTLVNTLDEYGLFWILCQWEGDFMVHVDILFEESKILSEIDDINRISAMSRAHVSQAAMSEGNDALRAGATD